MYTEVQGETKFILRLKVMARTVRFFIGAFCVLLGLYFVIRNIDAVLPLLFACFLFFVALVAFFGDVISE